MRTKIIITFIIILGLSIAPVYAQEFAPVGTAVAQFLENDSADFFPILRRPVNAGQHPADEPWGQRPWYRSNSFVQPNRL